MVTRSVVRSPTRSVVRGVAEMLGAGLVSEDGLAQYVTNLKPANFHYWTRKLRRFDSQSEFPLISLHGDSITKGTSTFDKAIAQRLAEELSRQGLSARAFPFGFSGSAATQETYYPEVDYTGTWGSWSDVAGGKTARTTTQNDTVTYTPGYSADRIRIWIIRQTSALGGGGDVTIDLDSTETGTFRVLNGATDAQIATSSAGVQNYNATWAAAASLDAYVLEVQVDNPSASRAVTITNNASSSLEVWGAEAYNSGTPEILIRSFAVSGATANTLGSGTSLISLYRCPCDLAMVCLGRNDSISSNGISTTQYGTALDNIESGLTTLSRSSLLYWSPPAAAVSVVTEADQQAYNAVMKEKASTDIVYFDQYQRWRDRDTNENMDETGGGDWYDDTLHPSEWGSRDIAGALAAIALWNDRYV